MMDAVESGTRLAREFARALRALHGRLGGDASAASAIERWAAEAWSEADSGHVCIDVPDGADRAALGRSPVVGPASEPRPLVLDRGALYLHRLWSAENAVAQGVHALDEFAPIDRDGAGASANAEAAGGADATDPQLRAVACALTRRLTVLSGGPGTGKTTTLARLLVRLARVAPQARIAYAAPTGKAAARLAQSLAAQLLALDPQGELRSRLPSAGQTVHRLLGARGDGRAAGRTLLGYDLVIVDEASMLDIELAARLFDAVGPTGRLVLAGDRDQLASVEAGAVFADLCAAPLGGVIVLERNYRHQDAPEIGVLAASMREVAAGAAEVIDWPAAIGLAPAQVAAIVEEAGAAWHDAMSALEAGARPEVVLAAYDRHRVLAAMRDGPLGVEAINAALAAHVRRLGAGRAGADWYRGRLVMVTRNEPNLGLFNGDVGVCLPHPQAGAREDHLVVAFSGTEGVRLFPIPQMPACEDAWAMTVHKAQGSEFESVALVPAPAGHPLNTRELVYTGITRARRRLSVWGSREAIEEAARRPTRRHGRLAERLVEPAAHR